MLPPPVPAAPSANAWLPASTSGIAVPPSATSATASPTASADLAAATPSTSTTGPGTLPGFLSYLAGERRALGGDASEGPSESSVNIEDTEGDDFQSTIPNLERFYEQMAAKARLPEGNAASNWVLSMARSYRRLSKEKRRRGRLRALLQPAAQGALSAASSGGLTCPRPMIEQPGWSSNTDDSGYEAGYETDADESELSEWEGGSARQGHKRKLDALVHLTMKLNVAEEREEADDKCPLDERPPPQKTLRALGTRPVGLRLDLPHAGAPAFGGMTNAWKPMDGVEGAQSCSAASSGGLFFESRPHETNNLSAPAPSGLTMKDMPSKMAMDVG